MKRVISFILMLIIILGFVPTHVFGAEYTEIKKIRKYNNIYKQSNGLFRVELDGYYGFIYNTGEEVIPLQYQYATNFSEGLALVYYSVDDEVAMIAYIDTNGKYVSGILNGNYGINNISEYRLEDHRIWPSNSYIFSEGMAIVTVGKKAGYINREGVEIVLRKYDYADKFIDGMAQVSLNGKYGFIDQTGKEVVSLKYDAVSGFSENMSYVKLNDKEGFVDNTGKYIFSLKKDYTNINQFSDGLVKVQQNSKWLFLDKTGKEVLSLKYDYVTDFSDGVAEVMSNNKIGIIDKTGKEIVPIQYDSINKIHSGIYIIEKDGFSTLISVKTNNISKKTSFTTSPTSSKVLVNGTETAFMLIQ